MKLELFCYAFSVSSGLFTKAILSFVLIVYILIAFLIIFFYGSVNLEYQCLDLYDYNVILN